VAFQSSYSSTKTQLPNVLLLSAGVDQTIICGSSTIFLDAVVDDEQLLTGHSMLWEQLTGATVVLSTPNALSTTFQFLEPTDKIFRFWLDKGTPYAQSANVRIFHTPTSQIPSSGLLNTQLEPHPFATTTDINIVSSVLTAPLSGADNSNVIGIDAVKLSWTAPTLIGLAGSLIRTELYRKDNVPDIGIGSLEGTVYPTDGKPLEFIGIYGYYTIRSVFALTEYLELDGSPKFTYFDTTTQRGVGFTSDIANRIIDDVIPGYDTTSVINLTRYTIRPVSVLDLELFDGSVVAGSVTINRYTNILAIAPTDIMYSGSVSQSTTININRINQSGIGGNV